MEGTKYTYKGLEIHRLRYHTLELLCRSTGDNTLAGVLYTDLHEYVLSDLGEEKTRALYGAGWRPEISVGFERLTVELHPPD